MAGGTCGVSGRMAGASPGLLHVRLDWCCEAPCACWKRQFSAWHVLFCNLRQIGFPLCKTVQGSRLLPLPFTLPFFLAGSALCGLGAWLLGARCSGWGLLASCAAGCCLAGLGRSMSKDGISMRPCVSSWNALSIDHLRLIKSMIVFQICLLACRTKRKGRIWLREAHACDLLVQGFVWHSADALPGIGPKHCGIQLGCDATNPQ